MKGYVNYNKTISLTNSLIYGILPSEVFGGFLKETRSSFKRWAPFGVSYFIYVYKGKVRQIAIEG